MSRPVRLRPIVAVVDDALIAGRALEFSLVLARLEQRELELVFVESAAALEAAAIPATQALSHAAGGWTPFAPGDVERAWRAQAARVQRLVERLARQHAVKCSLQVRRGALRDTVASLFDESGLLLLDRMGLAQVAGRARRPARLAIVAVDDHGAGGAQAVQLASRLASALAAQLLVCDGSARSLQAASLPRADLLVLPGVLLTRELFVQLQIPVLLVGADVQRDATGQT